MHRDPSKYFALVVGNNDAPTSTGTSSRGSNGRDALTKCVQDARDVYMTLLACGYPRDNVMLLTNASQTNIMEAVKLLSVQVEGVANCTVAVFFAGHAFQSGVESLLVPADADESSEWEPSVVIQASVACLDVGHTGR
jgi:hypothetical protein